MSLGRAMAIWGCVANAFNAPFNVLVAAPALTPTTATTRPLQQSAWTSLCTLSHPFIPHACCWEKLHWRPSLPLCCGLKPACRRLSLCCGLIPACPLWLPECHIAPFSGCSWPQHPFCSSAGLTHAAWARTGAGVEQAVCRITAVVWLQGSTESASGVNMYQSATTCHDTHEVSLSTEGTLLHAASAEQKEEGRLHPRNGHPMTQRHQHTAQACDRPLNAHTEGFPNTISHKLPPITTGLQERRLLLGCTHGCCCQTHTQS